MNKYPDHIMEILRQRNGLEPDDATDDAVITEAISPRLAFREVIAWKMGDPSWAQHILYLIEQCGGRVVWGDEQ